MTQRKPGPPRGRPRNVADLEAVAHRRLPSPIWHYLQGAADDEWTNARNRAAFDEVALAPRVLADVSTVNTATTLMGRPVSLPLVLSPTGMSRLFHPDKELGVSRAAAAEGLLYGLSTMATTSIEDVAKAGGERMFQLYWLKDTGLTESLLARAEAAGFGALCLTVDTHVAGNRERDHSTGMSLPPRFSLSSLLDLALHPRWSLPAVLDRHAFDLPNLPETAPSADGRQMGVIQYVNSQMDRSVGWRELDWLRARWKGRLLLKGVSAPQDARRAVEAGCEGVIISNHGGRQLDGCVSPFEQLPAIRAAVGDGPTLIVDGGVRRGTHVLKAIALGADACSIGRPYLYGLAADGERGVRRVIEIFRQEIERGLALMGCADLASLTPEHVRRVGEAVQPPLPSSDARPIRRATSIR